MYSELSCITLPNLLHVDPMEKRFTEMFEYAGTLTYLCGWSYSLKGSMMVEMAWCMRGRAEKRTSIVGQK